MVENTRKSGLVLGAILLGTALSGAPVLAEGDPGAGQAKYQQLCSFCHGNSGKGDGPAAKGFPVRPSDHTNRSRMRALTDEYLKNIIKNGGRSVGKSPLMPPFGNQFSEADVQNLLAYIRSLSK